MENLAIVIPLYNEADCLPGLIKELDSVIAKIDAQTIVYAVNDGSKDKTGEMLETFCPDRPWLKVISQNNSGHGMAIRNGYDHAIASNADWVFQCDSDQQIPLIELLNLWKMHRKGESILGVRTNRQDPSERLLVSSILRTMIKLFFGVSLRDANCPFRLFPKTALSQFLKYIPKDTFAPNVFLSIMTKTSMPVQEAFVSHLPRRTGTNSINRINLLKVCVRCLGELISFWRSRKKWPKLQSTHPSSL